jgi:hypothetical protein
MIYMRMSCSRLYTSSCLCELPLPCSIEGLCYDSDVMRPFSQTVFMLLLNRLQGKPSTQFTSSFVYLVCFLSAIDNVGPDYVISILDGIQPG